MIWRKTGTRNTKLQVLNFNMFLFFLVVLICCSYIKLCLAGPAAVSICINASVQAIAKNMRLAKSIIVSFK